MRKILSVALIALLFMLNLSFAAASDASTPIEYPSLLTSLLDYSVTELKYDTEKGARLCVALFVDYMSSSDASIDITYADKYLCIAQGSVYIFFIAVSEDSVLFLGYSPYDGKAYSIDGTMDSLLGMNKTLAMLALESSSDTAYEIDFSDWYSGIQYFQNLLN